MRIELNGVPHELPDATTVADLITDSIGSARGSAAVVDDEVLPRAAWAGYRLRAGQRGALITAVPGG